MTRHLITGIAGQDGILLARFLVDAGHEVIGTAPSATSLPGVRVETLDVTDTAAFARVVASHRPAVIHNLAGKSSVGQSWRDPESSDRVNRAAVLGMLDVLSAHSGIAFLQASSAEIFGDLGVPSANESTPLDPQSPYAEAKAAAHLAVQQARREGFKASNLVLFGHTSEFQPARFALPSVCIGAAAVAKGEAERLEIQNPRVRRDWGSARDHVRAFALAAATEADDFVIGTGELTRLGDIAAWALAAAGAPATAIDVTGSDRPTDHDGLVADSSNARAVLGWQPEIHLREEIEQMVRARL